MIVNTCPGDINENIWYQVFRDVTGVALEGTSWTLYLLY